MPTPVKTVANLQKNLTAAERDAREAAEHEILPDRQQGVKLVMPKLMVGNTVAKRYWKQILARMEGLDILDDLDSEALGVYCSMLAREELLCKQLGEVAKELEQWSGNPKATVDALTKLDALNSKLQSLERNLLQYAEKLCLTPAGRARLAQKRAEAVMTADPDGDLFGD